MAYVTQLEAENRLGELLDLVSQGEEVVITRQSKPSARLVAEKEKVRDMESVREAVRRLQDLQKEIAERTKGEPPMTWEELKSSIEEGRR